MLKFQPVSLNLLIYTRSHVAFLVPFGRSSRFAMAYEAKG